MAVGRDLNKSRPPLDQAALEQLALRYVGRYATSRARLCRYLERKLKDRGWADTDDPSIDDVAARMVQLGYVDDAAFASARSAELSRRGYGPRRVREALRAAGIADEDALAAATEAQGEAWAAALRLARRRSIGPFAAAEPDRRDRERALGVLLRAGHSMDVARRLAFARPGEFPPEDGG
ncbi:MAG TPA: RecX family transcriptional regulator [Allosphingosinicella sp.]|jgi:regulatory protein